MWFLYCRYSTYCTCSTAALEDSLDIQAGHVVTPTSLISLMESENGERNTRVRRSSFSPINTSSLYSIVPARFGIVDFGKWENRNRIESHVRDQQIKSGNFVPVETIRPSYFS